jgi:pimeloyl-ACP methyl ester carboxylesterase
MNEGKIPKKEDDPEHVSTRGMERRIIETKSFELSIIAEGDTNASKLALLCPGRLDTKDYMNFHQHLETLSKKGFLAVAFDPPGTWESPGGIDLYTTTNYIKSVNELINFFGNRPTLLIGHSRGAATSLLVAKDNPNVIGVVALMPNLGSPSAADQESRKRGYKVSKRDLPPGTQKTDEQKIFNLPLAYFEDGEQYDPASAAKILKIPKMVIYADRDEFMTPQEAEEACKEIPEPKVVRQVSSTHDYRYYPEVIKEADGLIERFTEDQLSTIGG